MILNRTQFAAHFNQIQPGLGEPHSVLWAGERGHGYRCEWFLWTPRLANWQEIREEYWQWCNLTLQGRVACYSLDDVWEWWGFTQREDIVIWTLKWQ